MVYVQRRSALAIWAWSVARWGWLTPSEKVRYALDVSLAPALALTSQP